MFFFIYLECELLEMCVYCAETMLMDDDGKTWNCFLS